MSGSAPGALQTVMWSAAGIEKEVDHVGNKTKLRTYLPLGLGYTEEVIAGTAIASTATGARSERYFHKDHLGSLNVITDGGGAVLQRMGFDSWGRRRDANGTDMPWSVLGSAATSNMQDKTGYTGQEQLDGLGLVHLNGRVYDPMTGRMTSADPTIPNPYDLQSLNRASYVNNNPLGFTDPTGFVGEGMGTGPVVERETPQAAKAKNGGEIWGLGTDVTQRAPLGAIGPSSAQSAPQSAAAKTDGKTADKGTEPAGLGFRPKIQGWIDSGVEASGYNPVAKGLGAAGTAFNEVFVPDSKTEVGLAMLGPLGKVGKLGKFVELVEGAEAAKSVLPAAAKIDPVKIREIESIVRSGGSSFPLDAGAQLRAVVESFANKVRNAASPEAAVHIRDVGLGAIDRLDRFKALTPDAVQQLRTIVNGAFKP